MKVQGRVAGWQWKNGRFSATWLDGQRDVHRQEGCRKHRADLVGPGTLRAPEAREEQLLSWQLDEQTAGSGLQDTGKMPILSVDAHPAE
jgi:hypothetical protein